jgi:hypothetical protein
MTFADDELIAIARSYAAAHGYEDELDASVTIESTVATVLLSNPLYARGGGLLVIVDLASGHVTRAVPQI